MVNNEFNIAYISGFMNFKRKIMAKHSEGRKYNRIPGYTKKVGGKTVKVKPHVTGEKPGVGTYKCTKCGEIIRLDDDSDTLPPCPRCDNTSWTKIG
jgi:rubrerythrin